MVAVGTGSIAVDLQDIPNAPIRFTVCFYCYYIIQISNQISFKYRLIQPIKVDMKIP